MRKRGFSFRKQLAVLLAAVTACACAFPALALAQGGSLPVGTSGATGMSGAARMRGAAGIQNAAEGGLGLGGLLAGEDGWQLGELSVYTGENGAQEVRAVLDQEERILAEPEAIAALAGASLTVEGNQYHFQRSHYVVSVDVKTGAVQMGLLPVNWRLYGEQSFQVEGIRTLTVPKEKPESQGELSEAAGGAEETEDVLFLPLEPMLYLLHVQWFCHLGRVYCFAPAETLWDLTAEYAELFDQKPTYGEIFCTQDGSFNSKGYYFGALALADDIDWTVCVEYLYDLNRVEDALLTLAIPCENLNGALQTKAEQAVSPYIGDLIEMGEEFGTVSGGMVSTLDFLSTRFTAWSDYKMPDYLGPATDVFSTAVGVVGALQTSYRCLDWTEGYVSQLEMLAELDHPQYEDACKLIREAAGGLVKEYGDPEGNRVKEVFQSLALSAMDVVAGKAPAGIALSALKASVALAKANSPKIASLLEAGDSVSIAKRLCDVSVPLRMVYSQKLVQAVRGENLSLGSLRELSDTGKLVATVHAHSLDALYSAAFSLAQSEDPSVTEEEALAREGSEYSMQAIGDKLVGSQAFALRFQEAEQYLPSLVLEEDFANLYSEESGACRQKIPPEYVIPAQVENNGGNVVGYQGNLYYWRYSAESMYPTALFANFYAVDGTVNSLICRHEDGSEEVLLTAAGNGPIFITGNRLYLQNGTELFSVALDGSGRVDHGAFEVWAADGETGMLWGTSYQLGGGVYRLSSADHSVTQLASQGDTFLGTWEGIYYFASSSYEETGSVTLWAASADGSQIQALDTVAGPPDALYLGIQELARLGDTLYYSYGYYAGTGGFFQDGGIRAVGVDGSQPRDCVPYGQLRAEEFVVEDSDGQTLLYYIGDEGRMGSYIGYWDDYPYSGCTVKNLDTGTVQASAASFSRPGSFVCMGGGIYRMPENSHVYEELLSPEEAAAFGFVDNPQGTEETLALISQLDVVGEQVIFTVDESRREQGDDMGWRPSYRREKSTVYQKTAGSSEWTELYSY